MDRDVVWDIPAEAIAHARAECFAERDAETTYGEEFEYTLRSNFEPVAWAGSNKNWVDVEPHTRLVPK